MARKVILAADLLVKHGDKIKELYETGATVVALKNKYECSSNTMVKVLMKLGFEGPKWAKKRKYADKKTVK